MKKTVVFASIILAFCLALGGCSAVDRMASGAYTEGDAVITEEIYKIDIEWPQGGVIVRGSESAKDISIRETSTEGAELATRIIGSVLYIRSAMPGKEDEAGEKTLMVIVPSDYNYREIEIRTQSANAGLRMLKASRADIETVSGKISVIACDIDDEAELESISGSITVKGNVADYDIQTESGSVEITADSIPDDIDIETQKGIIIAYLPAETPAGSIKAKTEGSFSNDLTNTAKGKHYAFESETGSVFILKNLNKQ